MIERERGGIVPVLCVFDSWLTFSIEARPSAELSLRPVSKQIALSWDLIPVLDEGSQSPFTLLDHLVSLKTTLLLELTFTEQVSDIHAFLCTLIVFSLVLEMRCYGLIWYTPKKQALVCLLCGVKPIIG